jgi:hypothetical protein
VLGYNLPQYIPLLLVIIVLFNLFDVYGKILKTLGVAVFEYKHDDDNQTIVDGEELVRREQDNLLVELESMDNFQAA